MSTLRIRVSNSFNGTTQATAANSSIAKVAGSADYWTLGDNAGVSFVNLGIIPLAILEGFTSHQDYVVKASLEFSGAPALTDWSITPVVLEGGPGGTAFAMGQARSVDPNVTAVLSEIFLAGKDYGISVTTTGDTGVQNLVLELIPVDRPAVVAYGGGELDGAGTSPTASTTDNVLINTAVDILSATAATYRYVHSGATKTLTKISTVIQVGTIAGAAATITASVVGVGAVTNGVITIAVADTVGAVDTTVPTAVNTLTDGDVLLFTVGGGNTANPSSASLTIELT